MYKILKGGSSGAGDIVRRRFTKSERWQRMVNNDMENIPLGLIVLWACVICRANSIVTSICALGFLFARILHSICYAKHWQPWRTVTYVIGELFIAVACFVVFAGAVINRSYFFFSDDE